MKKLVICLTGGVASGKTYISDLMMDYGFEVIDADVLSRVVVEKGSKGLFLLIEQFGERILADDGSLNRLALKQMVFNDADKLNWLNGILHPLILGLMSKQLSLVKQGVVVLVVPLLNEQINYSFDVNRVLVVDVDKRTQVERIMKRDNVSETLALKIIQSQPSRNERLSMADDVIVNNRDLLSFKNNSTQLIQSYLKINKANFAF